MSDSRSTDGTHDTLDVVEVLDSAPVRRFQVLVIALCFALIMVDGFDTQNIAFVAPALREAWGISPNVFGLLFSAGLIGTMIGAMVLGTLGDRIGRRPVILASTLVFGVMSLLSAVAPNVEILVVYRFINGLGLGGLLPNAIALVAEFSPRRVRSTAVVTAFIGFPLGAMLGGMASAHVIPAFGWEMVFLGGGVIQFALLAVVWWKLPESLRFLSLKGGAAQRIVDTLTQIRPELAGTSGSVIGTPQRQIAKRPVRQLFEEDRAAWTLYLWLLAFSCLLLTYFLVHWIPLVLVDAGIDQQNAIIGVALLNLGGIVGSLAIGRWSDRRGPYLAMGIALGLATAFIALTGFSVQAGTAAVLGAIFIVGLTFVGAQLNLSALAATNYPDHMRSAGTGASIAAGRVGSIVGPLIGGLLISLQITTENLFLAAVVPAALALFSIVAMGRIKARAATADGETNPQAALSATTAASTVTHAPR